MKIYVSLMQTQKSKSTKVPDELDKVRISQNTGKSENPTPNLATYSCSVKV